MKSSGAQQPESSEKEQIRLSAGVALPQTGPEGMLMSFSVDYELKFHPGTAPNKYVWVIERTRGDPAKIPVHLSEQQGNLINLIQGWRVADGPFQTHIEDNKGNRLSPTVELLGQN